MTSMNLEHFDLRVDEVLIELLNFCRANGWAGYDPYDALNSRVFHLLPFLNARLPRIGLTQALKRSPVNFRSLALVPKAQVSKALALFLSGLLKLPVHLVPQRGALCQYMVDRIASLRSPDSPYWCWGYSFPWQTRQNLVPANAPNLVCTAFVANSLLDAYEAGYGSECLTMAESAADYILNELYWTEGEFVAGFSYPLRSLRVQVHNANFLAAALLCRVALHTGREQFFQTALRATRYSASKQEKDGAWFYGEAPFQRWIDNFHTGYNLCALRSIAATARTTEFDQAIQSGLEYYCAHFIRPDGAARYFHDATYPIDVHCTAQTIITLLAFRDLRPSNLELASSVLRWAMEHLWDPRGYFYYRELQLLRIRIPYMRWSEAWMFLALATVLSETTAPAKTVEFPAIPVEV